MKKSNLKSTCCKADIKYSDPAPDFIGDKNPTIGTCYCICSECKKPCNIMINKRRTWKINPVTKVKGDKREKQKRKETNKEIKENS
jgi:hypothetical protein